jgi:hypothetical protein
MYADSNRAGGYFYAGKTHNRRFRDGFRRSKDFFDPQIVLPERSGRQFLSQKVEALSKQLEKSPIMCFSNIQKLTSQTIRISGALVFSCIGATKCPIFFVLSLFMFFMFYNVWNI